MSQRLQNEVEAIAKDLKSATDTIAEIVHDVAKLKEVVEELEGLIGAMTRASTPKGKAA